MAASEDESEWEYEYDQDSTDDFYLTLDLTTHIPPALGRDKRAKPPKSTTRASNKSLANAPGSKLRQAQSINEQNDNENAAANPAERMQIVGLHDKNPVLSYNNSIYSCQWATDLATQIFLTPPPADLDPDHPPLRSTPSFDVLGTTSARIVAVPATIQPRESAPLSPVTGPSSFGPDTSYTTAEGDIIQHTTTQGLRIELPSTASGARASQAKFLEALSAIKARHGDRDAVPVTNIKVYHPPEGWEEERAKWIEKESARSQKDKAEVAARITRQNRRAAYARPTPDEQDENGSADEDAEQEGNEPDTQENAEEENEEAEEEPAPASLVTRKRRIMRGGNRGGAPSGKRLRQSLGLPEARRDKRPRGRPRKSRTTAAAAAIAEEESQEPAEAQAEQGDTATMDTVGAEEMQEEA